MPVPTVSEVLLQICLSTKRLKTALILEKWLTMNNASLQNYSSGTKALQYSFNCDGHFIRSLLPDGIRTFYSKYLKFYL